MSLDKLRELVERASPGPWTHASVMVETQNTEIRLASEYDAKLATLSHLLLPAMEIVGWKGCDEGAGSPGDGKSHCDEADPCGRCAVLAQLEEALRG